MKIKITQLAITWTLKFMKTVPTFEEFQARSHFLLLDGIRAVAILSVLRHRFKGQTFTSWSLFRRGYLGGGLSCFSGFLIHIS
jgi:peptidoglycan/LPS O-acetylase OafA/YrhL